MVLPGLPADLVGRSLSEAIKLYFEHSLSLLTCAHWCHWILWTADQSRTSSDKYCSGWGRMGNLHSIFCSTTDLMRSVEHATWALLQKQLSIVMPGF